MVFLRLLYFFGFVIGHIATLSFSLNWWYGQRFSNKFTLRMRMVTGALVVAGIVGVAWLFARGYTPGLSFGGESSRTRSIAGGYILWCLVLGFVGVPLLSLYRWLRPRPKQFTDSQSTILDVADKLGYRPLGRGRYRLLARLPGNQLYQVEMSEKTFALPQLPKAWHGLTILHLTDLHFHGTPDRIFFQTVINACMARRRTWLRSQATSSIAIGITVGSRRFWADCVGKKRASQFWVITTSSTGQARFVAAWRDWGCMWFRIVGSN